jgi:hypothetical protein
MFITGPRSDGTLIILLHPGLNVLPAHHLFLYQASQKLNGNIIGCRVVINTQQTRPIAVPTLIAEQRLLILTYGVYACGTLPGQQCPILSPLGDAAPFSLTQERAPPGMRERLIRSPGIRGISDAPLP